MVGKEIESQTNILYVPVKKKTRVLGERAKNKRRTRKREIHPFVVEFAELR